MSNFQYIAIRSYFLPGSPAIAFMPPRDNSGNSGSTPPSRIDGLGLSFLPEAVFLLSPIHLPLTLRSPRVIAAACATLVAAGGAATYLLTRRRPSPEELERIRRDQLAISGRITDGTIMDTLVSQARAFDASLEETPATPNIIVYNYRIAGVTYECAQDVSALPELVHDIRTDLPIQVRYAPQNPGNSIVVAESWSGLRLKSSSPHESVDRR